MTEFLEMGGYAKYVWSAFGLTLAILVANIVVAQQQFRSVRTRLAQRWANQQQSSDQCPLDANAWSLSASYLPELP